jgi:GntR family transcriptional regulator
MEQNGTAPQFVVDPEGPDVFRQIIDQVADRVALGLLGVYRSGDKLPTVAQLEEELGVSHGTIVRVNKYLESVGIARGQQKGGTKILDMPPDVRDAVITGFAARRISAVLLELRRLGVPLRNVKQAFTKEVEHVYGASAGGTKRGAKKKQ